MSQHETVTEKNAALTPAQRELVGKHLGLVGLHLRRNVRNLQHPRTDREWDDLFQEGCLGLMQAARGYRDESGIPFPATPCRGFTPPSVAPCKQSSASCTHRQPQVPHPDAPDRR